MPQQRIELREHRIQVAPVFEPLLGPMRYKGAVGGRGGAKSHFFAEQIVVAMLDGKRCVCIREVQATIKDSSRELIVSKIYALGLDHEFKITATEIRAFNGGLCVFRGMQSYNAENIKSLEGFDIAWVEEAQALSKRSLRLLRPTLRKDGSELWFSWNARHETDAVDEFFRTGDRNNMIMVVVNWRDNPWFPATLNEERLEDKRLEPDHYDHVWEGGYELISEAYYFSKYIAQAEMDGRVGHFPYNPALPVFTSWDIGVDDYTAVWFLQTDGKKVWIIDFWETSGDGADEIVAAAMPELLPPEEDMRAALDFLDRQVPFSYGKHYFPHDVMVREWGAGAKTRKKTLEGLGVSPIHVGSSAAGVAQERINAIRAILPVCYFNNTKRVKVGLTHLRRFARKHNQQLDIYTTPLHDEHSHASEAFGEFAINKRIAPPKPDKPDPKPKELVYSVKPGGVIQGNMNVREAVDAMVKRRRQNDE